MSIWTLEQHWAYNVHFHAKCRVDMSPGLASRFRCVLTVSWCISQMLGSRSSSCFTGNRCPHLGQLVLLAKRELNLIFMCYRENESAQVETAMVYERR